MLRVGKRPIIAYSAKASVVFANLWKVLLNFSFLNICIILHESLQDHFITTTYNHY